MCFKFSEIESLVLELVQKKAVGLVSIQGTEKVLK